MPRRRPFNFLKSLLPILALVLALPWGAAAARATGQGAGAAAQKSLYARLGGYDAVAAVVDDFVGRLVADPQFAPFFVGLSNDSKKRVRQHIVDQFCAAAGGPCIYTGRTMKTSHEGLGITGSQWDAAAKLLVTSLDKLKVPAAEKAELLAFVATVRKDIVEK